MTSPTKAKRPIQKKNGKKNRTATSAAARRVKPTLPEIMVKLDRPHSYNTYARAHLRNKRGYVYLCWRDEQRIRNFYLGKAPKS